MGLKLFGALTSSCTQRVLITLKELGLEYELAPIELMKGEQKNPDYVSTYHPFGRIPVLQDGDIQLFESRAICKYLVAKYGKSSSLDVEKTDASAYGRWELLLSIDYSYFEPSLRKLCDEKLWKSPWGTPPDSAEVEKATATVLTCFDYFEAHIQKETFLAGNDFTLLDIFSLTWVPYIFRLGLEGDFKARPKLAALWKRVSSRPSWKKVLEDAGQA